MHISHHADQRMNQRGISRRLVEFTLMHGRIEGDKRVLDRNESRRVIERLTEELRLAKQVMDKGGVTVIESDRGMIITTYNVDEATPRRRVPTQVQPRFVSQSPACGTMMGCAQAVAGGVSCL